MRRVICPTVTAFDEHSYKQQIELVSAFAERIHIDCMDGDFAPTISPSVAAIWWPKAIKADLHIMYRKPMSVLDDIMHKRPHLVVVHAEAEHVSSFVHTLHEERLRVGIAILPDTPVDVLHHYIKIVDHVLVFSGRLGYHGGHADLSQVHKVQVVRAMSKTVEIGWDGGITEQNIGLLVGAGVQVFNVGSSIHSADNPQNAYENFRNLIQS